jgi:spore maturation protein CgeB
MRRPLRVLIPNFPAPDSFVDNVTHTLRTMGSEVVTADRLFARHRGRVSRLVDNLVAGAFPQWWSDAERWLVAKAREWRPDVLLCLTQSLKPEVLRELKRLGVGVRVAWWGDAPANMRGMGLLTEEWDHIYIKDAVAVAKFRAVGLNADLLHEAMNPEWHRPQGMAPGKQVVVAGNYYGYRQMLVSRLIEAGVPLELHGTPPPRWGDPRVSAYHSGRYVTRAEKSAAFEGALASLNSTSLSEGDSLNCRAFEICGAGGLQLIEQKPVVAECFEPGREVLTYDSVQQILEHLKRAETDPAWAAGVRAAGHRRALAHHTYAHRLTHILRRAGLAAALSA